jgi:hypothetical protein
MVKPFIIIFFLTVLWKTLFLNICISILLLYCIVQVDRVGCDPQLVAAPVWREWEAKLTKKVPVFSPTHLPLFSTAHLPVFDPAHLPVDCLAHVPVVSLTHLPLSSLAFLPVVLKVPKHEIFDGVFFASKEPIWSRDSWSKMVLNTNSNSPRYSIK